MDNIINNSHTYFYNWKNVTYAFWKKYPNPLLSHVIDIDILDRHIDDKGCLHTTRLITCKYNVPKWISNIVGGKNYAYVLEKSFVDPHNKTLIIKSNNLSYNNLLHINEFVAKIKYYCNFVYLQY